MPAVTPCPGSCNNAWRRAEQAATTTGIPTSITPAWGDPVHCWNCVDGTYAYLDALPELLIKARDEGLDGTPAKLTGTIGRTAVEATWPGQNPRLFVDDIVGKMAELQADILKLRHLWAEDRRPERSTSAMEDEHIAGIAASLMKHWDWAMQTHPAAAESWGRDNANPGGQVSNWYWRAKAFIKDDRQPDEKRLAPCPRCRGPWLENSRDLRLVADEPYVVCKDEDCQRVMTMTEYREYVAAMHKALAAAA